MKTWFINAIKEELSFNYKIAPSGSVIITIKLMGKIIDGIVFSATEYKFTRLKDFNDM